MKTGPGFKLSKSTKRILATMTGDMYGVYKRMMIDAELSAAIQPKREKRPAGPGGYAKNPTGTASTRN